MEAVQCIGALDQGTQSTRFLLYDSRGEVLASSQLEFPQHCPRSGWTEHDPEEIWDSVEKCIAGALEAAGEKGLQVDVRAVGITNQRETVVVWDRATGRALHNAVVWLDTRTAPLCDRMAQELGGVEYFRKITGLPINPYFSAYKLKWLLENVPAVASAAEDGSLMFGTVDSYLIWRLTGGVEGGQHVTDVTNAARTNLMDLASRSWHAPTMALFGATAAMLPRIRSNAETYGEIAAGPLAGVAVAGCLGDQMAAMLGQRCRPQQAKNTYGTGCFMLLNTGAAPVPSTHGLLTTVAYQLGPDAAPQYALEGSIAIAGAGVSWLRDKLGVLESASQSQELAASVPDTAGVYFVPAFGGLMAPRWRSDARGAILGLTSYSTKAHVVRAMLEAMCFQTREVSEAMCRDAGTDNLEVLRVDGGASANDLLMQLQADILQVPVHRPAHQETTSLGAAYAAGIAVGFWSEGQVVEEGLPQEEVRIFQPSITAEAADKRFGRWNLAVKASYGLSDLAEDS
mmetsp:Transcript_12324/g.37098  ORF Transcript_12324/g.37098 Transcript_12324/m.37098 type:complete len:513 (-) Transcript_12324:411-1949(-)